jgi:hypothetical protein
MSDILGQYGKNSPQPQAAPAKSGGVTQAKEITNYSPPRGPSNINDPKTPGLHGDNHGVCGTQGKR